MCYSVESSAKTTLFSFIAILYLLFSNNPYYKWIAITLIGWCMMQFAEMLLWLTEPNKGCTKINTIITLTLIPLVLVMQPLGSLLGSLFVIPWSESTEFRKNFIIYYSIFIVLSVSWAHYYNPYKLCTTVTKDGHLFWSTLNPEIQTNKWYTFCYFIWSFLIFIPLLFFWKKDFLILYCLLIFPIFGFFYGLYFTDSRASIWCYYTSYTSIIASAFLFLKQIGVYDIVNTKQTSIY